MRPAFHLAAIPLAATLLVGTPRDAEAGPAARRAAARVEGIAAGDLAGTVAPYTERSTLEWFGGPLDGRYQGTAQLAEVWRKFMQAQGPLKAEVIGLGESANPKGQTVAAGVVLSGRSELKIRYVLVYREGRLVNEIWQVDPTLPG